MSDKTNKAEEKIETGPVEQEKNEGSEQGLSRRQILKGAAAVGMGALTLGSVEKIEAANKGAKRKSGTRNLSDLIRRMSSDADFAREVIANPRKFQEEYNLSDSAVRAFKGLYLEDFEALAITDPTSFAAGAMTAAGIAHPNLKAPVMVDGRISYLTESDDKIDGGEGGEGGDGCYYGG